MINPWRRLVHAFDLCSPDGRPSFSKLVTVAVLVTAILTKTFTLGMGIAILAASFGRSTFMAFLNRVQVDTAKETEALAKLVTARRDDSLGIEHTP